MYYEDGDRITFTIYTHRYLLVDVFKDVHDQIISLKTVSGEPAKYNYEVYRLEFESGLPRNDYGQTVKVTLRRARIPSQNIADSIVFAA